MKTPIFILGFLCSMVTVQAQFYTGIRGGLQLSTYNVETLRNRLKNSQGISIAVPLTYFIGEHVSVYTELAYTQRGSHAISFRQVSDQYGNPLMETQSMQTSVNYLEIPFFLRLSSAQRGVNIYGFIGPELSMALDGKTIISRVDGTLLEVPAEEILTVGGNNAYLERWVVGAAFGLGMTAPVGVGKLLLEARFHLGATDAFANSPNNKITNQSTQLSMGYLVELSR